MQLDFIFSAVSFKNTTLILTFRFALSETSFLMKVSTNQLLQKFKRFSIKLLNTSIVWHEKHSFHVNSCISFMIRKRQKNNNSGFITFLDVINYYWRWCVFYWTYNNDVELFIFWYFFLVTYLTYLSIKHQTGR